MKNTRKLFYTAVIIFVQLSASSQEVKLDEDKLMSSLKQHITVLASDRFEGRETGTKGEQFAADYIKGQFISIGLEPKGSDGFIQGFTFTDGIEYGENNALTLDNSKLTIDKDYYPLPYSANGEAKGDLLHVGFGINAPDLDYNDYKGLNNIKGKILTMELSSPDGIHPHSKYKDHSDIRQKIDTAIAKGASAVIFINSDTTLENPDLKNREYTKITPSTIPVLFAIGKAYETLLSKNAKTASLHVELEKTKRTGQNVVGFLDNHAANTAIIGAHYDHLGFGGNNSTGNDGEPAVHNGADDNASGTAAIIELARYLKSSNLKNNNYLFIAFSGEEKGLFGSNYFAKNATTNLENVNYMINMDMVGRLNPDEKTLSILGTGTTPLWKEILPGIEVDSIEIKTKESGMGPSDHAAFYLKDIPVLHFFSGFHTDYHKPSDDEDKINYEGEVSIIKFIINIVKQADDDGKLAFTKTKSESASSKNTKKPKVTLGVIPDYMFDGSGMRIEGLASEEKPGAKAGMKAGDIVIQVGEIKVLDMRSYMKAMGAFNKGDKTVAIVKRGDKELKLNVEF